MGETIKLDDEQFGGWPIAARVRKVCTERLKTHPNAQNVLVLNGEQLDTLVDSRANDPRVTLERYGESWCVKFGLLGTYVTIRADNELGEWEGRWEEGETFEEFKARCAEWLANAQP